MLIGIVRGIPGLVLSTMGWARGETYDVSTTGDLSREDFAAENAHLVLDSVAGLPAVLAEQESAVGAK